MKRKLLSDTFGWGFILWLVGYILGIILFSVVPTSLLGWIIMPLGIVITMFVLFKKIKNESFKYYVLLSFAWTAIAIVCDYFFLVKVFKPADGYYKLDVYIYYLLTFILPIFVGWQKTRFKKA